MRQLTLDDLGRLIPLKNGGSAVVDADMYDYLSQWEWHRHKHGYAVRYEFTSKKVRMIRMHRVINGTPSGVLTDHRNGDGLDNRRNNLRDATEAQNQWNRHRVWGKSRFKGVYWNKGQEKWHVRITRNKKTYHVGFFDDEEDAARAYNLAAQHFFGDFAHPNSIRHREGFTILRRSPKTSAYRGVQWRANRSRWVAFIYENGRRRILGSYQSETDAARAYNEAALNLYGPTAVLNQVS